MLRILHLADELLSLQLDCTELGLYIDIALVDVCSHLVLFEGQKTRPERRILLPRLFQLRFVYLTSLLFITIVSLTVSSLLIGLLLGSG